MSDSFITIVNPTAGGGRCDKLVDQALSRLRKGGLNLDVRFTERAGHAREIAQEAYAAGARQFISVGGDGTTFEVVNGLFPGAEHDDSVTLGLLPLGTGNSFLRDFGITSYEAAVDALLEKRNRRCDVVRARHADGEIHYINLLSIGFTARAGALTNDKFKPLGAAGYILATLRCVADLDYPVYPVKVDDGPLDDRPCVLLSFSNSRFTGGTMMMAPEADATDGELDVIRIGKMGRFAFVKAFPSIFKGTHVRKHEVEQTRAKHIDLEGVGATDVMVDGEVLNLSLRSLDVLPGALRVMA